MNIKIDKEKYLKNISKRLEDINYGSYSVDDEYAEDYFGMPDNEYEIMEELNNIIPSIEITNEQLNKIQLLIDNINIYLSEPSGYEAFTMFYKEEDKLGNVIWTNLKGYIID